MCVLYSTHGLVDVLVHFGRQDCQLASLVCKTVLELQVRERDREGGFDSWEGNLSWVGGGIPTLPSVACIHVCTSHAEILKHITVLYL